MILGWNHCISRIIDIEGGSAITESPKVGITKSHMHLKTWWTAGYFAVKDGWLLECQPTSVTGLSGLRRDTIRCKIKCSHLFRPLKFVCRHIAIDSLR